MMLHRRFGKTELSMPVITCGGMRYQQSWEDIPADEIGEESQNNLEATVARALELGINHIETARGYGSSERQLGRAFPSFSRESLIVQTKTAPQEKGSEFLAAFETSMERLQLEYVDLLALHGINNDELLERSLRKGGSLDVARKLQKEGRVGFVGFSTHGPCDTIVKACASGAFDYVNLHWYCADRRNAPAINVAREQDMGVLIISPCDKGGRLYDPPQKLVDLCSPFTPMGANDLFCLSRPDVHTISIGAARPSDFDAHVEVLTHADSARETIAPILDRLQAEQERTLGRAWMEGWDEGLPTWDTVPGQVNLYHTLRLYNLWKSLDMLDYARARYNLLGNGGHWFPGQKVSHMEWESLPACLAGSPVAEQIPDALREAHEAFDEEDKKRLSESG